MLFYGVGAMVIAAQQSDNNTRLPDTKSNSTVG
jgi:hypothetical protein